MLGCKLSHSYDDLNKCTDIKNNMGKFVMVWKEAQQEV
jgi:hypothetical protein